MIKKMSRIKGGINFNLYEEILSSVANALPDIACNNLVRSSKFNCLLLLMPACYLLLLQCQKRKQ